MHRAAAFRPKLTSVDSEAVAIGLNAPMVAHQRIDEVDLNVRPIEFAARFHERARVQVNGAPVTLLAQQVLNADHGLLQPLISEYIVIGFVIS